MPVLVLVVVIAMRGVTVPLVFVVDMVAVDHGFMPAAVAMRVGMVSMGDMGQRVLVVVAVVAGVGVPLMDVVRVTVMLHAGVPAVRSVVVGVLGMDSMPAGGHCSSLL